MPTCKFCQRKAKLIDAHIIPKSFYPQTDNKNQPMLLISSEREWASKSYTGIYDQNLVCQECEDQFSIYDQYAAELLLQNRSQSAIDETRLFRTFKNYDYTKLKLFFISILWRAGASSRAEFQFVELGVYLDVARKHLLNTDPGDKNFFAVNLFQFDGGVASTAFLNPHKERWSDINYYRFFLGGYMGLIKVDKRPAPSLFEDFCLSPKRDLTVGITPFEGSKAHMVLKKIAKSTTGRKTAAIAGAHMVLKKIAKSTQTPAWARK